MKDKVHTKGIELIDYLEYITVLGARLKLPFASSVFSLILLSFAKFPSNSSFAHPCSVRLRADLKTEVVNLSKNNKGEKEGKKRKRSLLGGRSSRSEP